MITNYPSLVTKEKVKERLNTTDWFTETTALDSFIENSVNEFSQRVGEYTQNWLAEQRWVEERFFPKRNDYSFSFEEGCLKITTRYAPLTDVREIRAGGTNREDSTLVSSENYYVLDNSSIVFIETPLNINSYFGIAYTAGFENIPEDLLSLFLKFVNWKYETSGKENPQRSIGGNPDPARAGVNRFKLDGAFYVEYTNEDMTDRFYLTTEEKMVLNRFSVSEKDYGRITRIFQDNE